MKKWFVMFMAVALVFTVAACGSANEGGSTETSSSPAEGQNAENKEIKKLTMGFVPSQEADKIADTVKPLEEKLSEILGIEIESQVMVDFVGLVEGMRTGRIDIGFTNPFGYVQAVDRAGVEVIVKAIRRGEDSYVAQYSVPADSPIESIEDLAATPGLSWAIPDLLSTSGFLFPAAQLIDMEIADLDTHFTQIVVGGHDNAILALLDGQADMATTFNDAREVVEKDFPDVKEKIRVIGYTDPIPNDGVSVSKDLSEDMKQKIKEAFLMLNEDEEMLAVMKEVYTWDGVAEAKDSDYDVVRSVFEKFKEQLQ